MKLHEIFETPEQLPQRPVTQPITQESWIEAILWAWKNHKNVTSALMYASKWDGKTLLGDAGFDALRAEVAQFRPKLPTKGYSPYTMPVAAWIAQQYPRSSDLLWAGKYEQAAKMLTKSLTVNGTLPILPKRTRHAELDADYPKRPNNELGVSRREINADKTDWKKVK